MIRSRTGQLTEPIKQRADQPTFLPLTLILSQLSHYDQSLQYSIYWPMVSSPRQEFSLVLS